MRNNVQKLITIALMFSASCGSAQAEDWNTSELCVAGGMAYFFLEAKPAVTDLGSGWVRLHSKMGNSYDCHVVGDRVSFSWINKSNKRMSSEQTKWKLDGDKLVVATEVQTIRFEKAPDGIKPLQ